jgi:ATP-binding cassette subfamily B protein
MSDPGSRMQQRKDLLVMSLSFKPSSFTYRDLFATYLRPQWQRVLLAAVLLLTGIALQLVNPQILSTFIDQAAAGSGIQQLIFAGLLFIGFSLLNQACAVVATYVSENVAWTATNRLRGDLVKHCLQLDMAFHKDHTSGEFIERIDGDIGALSNFFSQTFIMLAGNCLLIIGTTVVLFVKDWRIGSAILLFVASAILILWQMRNLTTSHWIVVSQKKAELLAFLSEVLIGTEDVRANGATGYVMRRFYQLLRNLLPISIKANLANATVWSTTSLIAGLANTLALILSAYLFSIHAITLGTAYIIFYYLNLLTDPIQQIRRRLQEMQQVGAGLARIKQLFQEQPTIVDGVGTPLPAGKLAVEFQNVTFGYQDAEPVLRHLDFQLPAGRVLGVVGRTGSGKTTLARLLTRLYDVQEGEIRLGDVPLQETRLHELRKRIGMVTQDIQLFNATVRDNLTFFNPAIGDEHILQVLNEVGLASWYRTLSDGLDTELGSDGEGLSAGEAQLLAFTRVFLADPGLVILDEASSRLDPATERRIEQAISKLLAGRTAIIIAHRLSTLERVDDILVLAAGHIVEYGERAQLAADPQSHFSQLLQTGLEDETSEDIPQDNAERPLVSDRP